MKKDERNAIKTLSERLSDVEPIGRLLASKDPKMQQNQSHDNDQSMFHLNNMSKNMGNLTAAFTGGLDESKREEEQDLDCLQNVLQK